MPRILGLEVANTSYAEVVDKAVGWALRAESRSLVFANVHVVMEAFDNASLSDSLNKVDITSPDGVPLVWALKLLGYKSASRVYGPDCTLLLLAAAEANHLPIALYGGSEQGLTLLRQVLAERFPALTVAAAISPPFRPLTASENEEHVRTLAASGARFVFVGLGCPKQEQWMMQNYMHIPAVTCAVGAAFDFIAGTKPQAPRWMMRSGLEWLFRFSTEPMRLYKRYMKQNPRFVFYFLRQLSNRSKHI